MATEPRKLQDSEKLQEYYAKFGVEYFVGAILDGIEPTGLEQNNWSGSDESLHEKIIEVYEKCYQDWSDNFEAKAKAQFFPWTASEFLAAMRQDIDIRIGFLKR